MTLVEAVVAFSQSLAEQGLDGDVEIAVPGRMMAAFVTQQESAFKFLPLSDPPSALHQFHIYGPSGRFTIRPKEPRDAKCPHGIPWDYCTPCEVSR
jgi:hypothetical protein